MGERECGGGWYIPGTMSAYRSFFASMVWVLILGAAVALGAPQQEPQDPPGGQKYLGGVGFHDEVEVTVLNLEVFVRDADGNTVTGLTREDFRVFQDGQPRKITNFAAFTEKSFGVLPEGGIAPQQEGIPTELPPGIKPISVVIFVDNEHIRPMERSRVLSQLGRFVSSFMRPPVRVMVVSYQRSVTVEQPFTDDIRLVKDALRRVRRAPAGFSERDTKRREILRDLQNLREKDPSQTGGAMAQMDVLSRIRSYADELSQSLDMATNSLRQLILSLSGLPGRKYLIHVSSGLPAVTARDLFEAHGNAFQRSSILPMLSVYDRWASWKSLAASANAQGIHMYMVDSSGLASAGSASAEYASPVDPMTTAIYFNNRQQPLQLIAETTGGEAILNANDVTVGLERFREDLFTYYSIGYVVGAAGGDTIHRVEVTVPGHPDYDLRYRRTVVEKSLASRVQDKVLAALAFGVEHNPMGIEVELGAASTATEDKWLVPVTVTCPMSSLALVPRGEEAVGEATVFVAVRDRDGRQSDLQRQNHELRLPVADYDLLKNRHFTFTMDLLMVKGVFTVAVGLLDQVSHEASYAVVHRKVP